MDPDTINAFIKISKIIPSCAFRRQTVFVVNLVNQQKRQKPVGSVESTEAENKAVLFSQNMSLAVL